MTLRFSDGGNSDTIGPLRVLHLAGYYVVGEGMSIPVNSREEAEKIIVEIQKRLGSDLDEDDKVEISHHGRPAGPEKAGSNLLHHCPPWRVHNQLVCYLRLPPRLGVIDETVQDQPLPGFFPAVTVSPAPQPASVVLDVSDPIFVVPPSEHREHVFCLFGRNLCCQRTYPQSQRD